MTKGKLIIPREAMKITSDKLMIGIHPKLLKSTPVFLRYKYVASTEKKRAVPILEIVIKVCKDETKSKFFKTLSFIT